ncbi:UDP:flavonoid glycosyltransferase YjiC (YdhE family) [Kribbella voronezhensis]|uniref:UDP:flavonoid glycosyltransferase YjiC (YdhE family) n=1 Tax=Kribbella voronezhensis TaxID=2512212 RepID=A0A4R7TEE8_9ACTN|nr:nucleotide disphospho-sugar-binding domain-containing protein [Kribbella voronezhensis]TDU90515.1 UDP:flavonoid glycosyltransferase YjiC (YdhE family) [Kribbella voronezhensis]
MICLLPHCAYLSETSRMLELHRALTELGVPVHVATHGGPHERLLTRAGVAYDVLGPGLSAARSAAFVASAMGQGDPRQSMYDDTEIRAYAQAEAEYFRKHGITVAVTGFTLTTLLSSRLAGVQLVTEHAGSFVPPAFERRLLPAPSSPVDPRLRRAPDWLSRFFVNRTMNRTTAYCGGFNRVAASLGVEQVPSLAALLLGDLSLVPEIPEILGISAAELASWRPGRGYRPSSRLAAVGPLFAHLDLPLPGRVQKFLGRPGPVVYVAMTSTPPKLVRAAVEALGRLDVRILVAGTIHDLTDLATDRIMVEGVLPSHLVMPQVDLAITTGGQGSTQTATASGTPLLGIPLHIEQDLNIALLERLDAARHVAPSDLDRLAPIATAMLDNPAHQRAAERLQKLYAAVDGPSQAAQHIAHLTDHPS